ncbi:MAG: WD40/YVTN/BNR-like repeat-containing protein, partial [Chthoniobacterales bacterium]
MHLRALLLLVCSAAFAFAADPTPAPNRGFDQKLFSGMKWRQVGPFRGGRASSIEGVPGEPNMRGNVTWGGGIFKSLDAGKTWKSIGLKDSRQIGAIVVDPKNADIALVAAFGHAFGPNQERGVFRTADGGKTWTKTLFKDENTGAIDL